MHERQGEVVPGAAADGRADACLGARLHNAWQTTELERLTATVLGGCNRSDREERARGAWPGELVRRGDLHGIAFFLLGPPWHN